jgi:hypothetical protein
MIRKTQNWKLQKQDEKTYVRVPWNCGNRLNKRGISRLGSQKMVTKLRYFPVIMAKIWEIVVKKHKKAQKGNLDFS